jgi:hypothetical protein
MLNTVVPVLSGRKLPSFSSALTGEDFLNSRYESMLVLSRVSPEFSLLLLFVCEEELDEELEELEEEEEKEEARM